MDGGVPAEKVNLSEYEGTFGSTKIPLKIITKVENGSLTAKAGDQQAFPLTYEGDGKFVFDMAGIEFQFSKDKKSFTLNQAGQSFEFTKQ